MTPGLKHGPPPSVAHGNPNIVSIRALLVWYAQALVHDRAGSGVLQELFLLRIEVVLDRERRERRLVESRQDELLLPGIGVDVTHREHAWQVRLEFLGIHLESFLLEFQTPL